MLQKCLGILVVIDMGHWNWGNKKGRGLSVIHGNQKNWANPKTERHKMLA